jgi:hypothetical protein
MKAHTKFTSIAVILIETYKLTKATAGSVKGSYFKLMANAGAEMSAYNEKYCYHSKRMSR